MNHAKMMILTLRPGIRLTNDGKKNIPVILECILEAYMSSKKLVQMEIITSTVNKKSVHSYFRQFPKAIGRKYIWE